MSARLRLAILGSLLLAPAGIALAAAPDDDAPAPGADAEPEGRALVRGEIRRAGDRSPLGGVKVFVYPAAIDARLGEVRDPKPAADEPLWVRTAETDEHGAFAIGDLPPSPGSSLALEVIIPGYLRARWIIDPTTTPRRGLRLFVRREEAAPYRTTVVSQKPRQTIAEPAPVERQLSREEIRTLPGSQGDPLRSLQALPGVARAPFGAGLLVLPGASPRQSQVFVGDHPIPFAFHLSGLSSVLPGGTLDDLSFAPSNFAPAYGNASGGLIVMGPRAGRRDAYHGEAYLDLGGVGAQAEGPVGKGSFLVAARRAHLDLPLRVVGSLNPYSAAIYPHYYDYQALYDRPLGGGRHLHVGFIGAGDRLSFRSPAETERERETWLEPQISFHRFDVAYRARVDRTSILITPALRLDSDYLEGIYFPGIASYKPRRNVVSTLRAQVDHRITSSWTLVVGADADIGRQTTEVETVDPMDPQGAPLTGSAVNSNITSQDHVYLGLYGEAVFRRGGTMLALGTRVSTFVVDGTDSFAVDPRLRLRQAIGERVTLSAGVGVYSQPWLSRVSGSIDLLLDYQPSTGHLLLPDQIRDNYRREELLDVGLRVLAEEGSRGLTHRAIDTRAKLPLGTCVNYFRSRDILLNALARAVFAHLTPDAASLRESAALPPSRERLVELMHELMARVMARPDLQIALWELRLESTRRPRLRELLTETLGEAFGLDLAFHREAGLPGGRREVVLLHLAIEGLILNTITLPEVLQVKQDRDALVEVIVERLVPKAEES